MSLSPRAVRALRDAYLEVFLIAEALRSGGISGLGVESIRSQLEDLVRRERQTLLAAEVPEGWAAAAQMAVVALTDEAAWQSSNRDVVESWSSLQFPLYNQEDLGRQFFDELEALKRNQETPIEVLEIYLECLACGFQGVYGVERKDELKIVREGLFTEIERRRGQLPPLSVHLSEIRRGVAGPEILEPKWIAAIAGVVVALLAVVLTFRLMLDVNEAEGLLAADREQTDVLECGQRPGGR